MRRSPASRSFFDKLASDLSFAKNDDEVRAVTQADVAKAVSDHLMPAAGADGVARLVTSPWAREGFAYDPLPALRKLRMPVLALNGSLDLQVPSKEDLGPIKAALKDDPRATVIELPGLNHLFQDAKNGSPNEYGEIEETMAPVAIATIADWVVAQAAGTGH